VTGRQFVWWLLVGWVGGSVLLVPVMLAAEEAVRRAARGACAVAGPTRRVGVGVAAVAGVAVGGPVPGDVAGVDAGRGDAVVRPRLLHLGRRRSPTVGGRRVTAGAAGEARTVVRVAVANALLERGRDPTPLTAPEALQLAGRLVEAVWPAAAAHAGHLTYGSATHHEDCWRSHGDCAVLEVVLLRERVAALERRLDPPDVAPDEET
jgi:hypothetical protein